jgi:hypothetical protein
MKFYEIDNALIEAIEKGDSPVRVRIEIAFSGSGVYETVFEQDIIEASFYGLKEAAGGTSAQGEVLLDNPNGMYCVDKPGLGAGKEVRISFSLGEGLPWFQRFVMYVDDKGFQDIRGPGRERRLQLGLRDLSYTLRKTDEHKDWTAPAVFTYSVICDKTKPEKSLVHLIAKRAGIESGDIDCATIPITLPYVKLTKNIWAELSELAKTYRAHLECAPEKPLVFAHSPYQSETENVDNGNPAGFSSYTFSGEHIFYLRETARAELYRNTVRLKINIPVALKKQEIWRYNDPPVLYDTDLMPVYPMRESALRDIEQYDYEALYTVKDKQGTVRRVIFADQIDTIETADNRLKYDGGPFFYSIYDITTHHDKAIITLGSDTDGDLYRASIFGRPIVLDLNRSCFVRDTEAVAQQGTCALNVTGSYFSEDMVGGIPMYEDWAARELAERSGKMPSMARREFTIKTHRGVFHGRVGALVKIQTAKETLKGSINALSLRYKREAAFEAAFRIIEG